MFNLGGHEHHENVLITEGITANIKAKVYVV